ncbi:winged helix-turn-helix domain-containing protein [Streptomyces buecherae]|uniref:winged helix-turn-helix domain-containing protein n=1 Tax=Streptomyces buecherae TaxID=2763006 RepID=UPI0037B5BDA5
MSERGDGASQGSERSDASHPAQHTAREARLTDARALRAYAHPTRMRLVGLLRAQGPRTATQAADLINESVASCSYHLRMLAKYGLVETAAGGRGREKPWRATARLTQWPTHSPVPAVAEAADAVELAAVERYSELLSAAIETRRTLPRDWQEAGGISDVLLYLTAGELSAIQQQIDALLRPFEARETRPDSRPPGARLVQVIRAGFPVPQLTASGPVPEANRATDVATTRSGAVKTTPAADSGGPRLDNSAGTEPTEANPAATGTAAVSGIPDPEDT